MAKTAVEQWDTTAANNTDINSIPIDGAVTTPSQVDNIIREMMAQIAVQMGEMNFEGADIASATTTNLANATGWALDITGTTTITGFGTVDAGKLFILRFVGALTLTHNATSLILPGAANIATVAGDIAFMKSEGSGNWRCVNYQRSSGVSTVGPSSSTDNTVPRFNGTAGALQTSGIVIDDSNNITGVAALTASATITTSNNRFTGTSGLVLGGGGTILIRPSGTEDPVDQTIFAVGGEITSTGSIVSGNNRVKSSVFGPAVASVMSFRPNGTESATGQMTIDTTGNVTSAAGITATGGNFAAPASTIFLRPNGAASATGQATIDTSGNIIGAAGITATGGNFAAPGATLSLRPNGAASATGQTTIDTSGNVTINGTLTVTG